MNDQELSTLLHTQKSLTEWLEEIEHSDARQLRAEDNDKRERLKVLNQVIELPFDTPTQFAASELLSHSEKFATYLKNHGDELCAIRLMPLDTSLPKLRMRGKTVSQAHKWFAEQKIDVDKYRVDFVPHIEASDASWSTIFVVNRHGIQGEIIFGGHHQLTQGFHNSDSRPATFSFNFKDWVVSPKNEEVLAYVKNLVRHIYIDDTRLKEVLAKQLEATFCNDYLEGYFETTDSSRGIWFIDYNQSLGRMYSDVKFPIEDKHAEKSILTGRVGSSGVASGMAKIINPDKIDDSTFKQGDILVCNVTTPMFIPLMKKAGAIITDQGGILSHAAIVARELGIPCIVGTQTATSLLKNGQRIAVDADIGTIKILS